MSNQYIFARKMFTKEPTSLTNTIFTDPQLHAAKIIYFAIHSFHLDESSLLTHAFALVEWLSPHPCQHKIGKPFEVYCNSFF